VLCSQPSGTTMDYRRGLTASHQYRLHDVQDDQQAGVCGYR
jgi:hypothetical protein